MLRAAIQYIEYHLPERVLTNEQLAHDFPEWSVEKIERKTGITRRHIAADDECASDLAVAAAEKLFSRASVQREDIDYVLFCTQAPDHFLPATACMIQERLGLPTTCGAVDVNQGCSGWVYSLGLAKGLIESGQAGSVLLLTGETYSKFLHEGDKSVRTLFGDAASATLVQGHEGDSECLGPFVYGTDGRGAGNLIVPRGGMRSPALAEPPVSQDEHGNRRTENHLYMNGTEIFTFTLEAVPRAVASLLESASVRANEVDLFVFHQANRFMLEHLRRRMKIDPERFVLGFEDCGNTVSATIPIALKKAECRGQLQAGQRIMVVGFGVGYSWSAAMTRWTAGEAV